MSSTFEKIFKKLQCCIFQIKIPRTNVRAKTGTEPPAHECHRLFCLWVALPVLCVCLCACYFRISAYCVGCSCVCLYLLVFSLCTCSSFLFLNYSNFIFFYFYLFNQTNVCKKFLLYFVGSWVSWVKILRDKMWKVMSPKWGLGFVIRPEEL